MTTPVRILAIATLGSVLALVGCGSSSNSPSTPIVEPPAPPSSLTFPLLVLQLLSQTSDTTEPTQINDLTLTFPNNDSPSLFDSVVGGP